MFDVKQLKHGVMERRDKIFTLALDYMSCKQCPIGCFSKNKVLGDGQVPAKYLFIGEAPGREEDEKGEPFVGKSGVLLRKTMRSVGLYKNFFITNTVACRPADIKDGPNRAPTPEEIKNCNNRLRRTIEIVNPKVIIAVGKVAARTLYGYKDELRINCNIQEIWHPAYILRNGGVGSNKYKDWFKQLKKILG